MILRIQVHSLVLIRISAHVKSINEVKHMTKEKKMFWRFSPVGLDMSEVKMTDVKILFLKINSG
jgi:hypothetical protein